MGKGEQSGRGREAGRDSQLLAPGDHGRRALLTQLERVGDMLTPNTS